MPVTTRSQAARNVHITNHITTGPSPTPAPAPAPYDEAKLKRLLDAIGSKMSRKLESKINEKVDDISENVDNISKKVDNISYELFCTKEDILTNTGRMSHDNMFNLVALIFLYTMVVIFLFSAFDIHIEKARDQITILTDYVMNNMTMGPIFPVFNNRYEDLTSHYYNIYANSSYVNETVVTFMEKVLSRALDETADTDFTIINDMA
jgi:hypothetical protein